MDAKKMLTRLIRKLESNRVIDQTSGCWIWTGSRRGRYGQLVYRSRCLGVHRLAAHVWLGLDLNSPDQVNHMPPCRNTLCFNPAHLYTGNQSQNQLDIDRGDKFPCGHDRDNNTYVFKNRHTGIIYRWCRLCRNETNRRRFQAGRNIR